MSASAAAAALEVTTASAAASSSRETTPGAFTRADILHRPDHLRACVDGLGEPFVLVNEFQRTISASEFVPPDYWCGGYDTNYQNRKQRI